MQAHLQHPWMTAERLPRARVILFGNDDLVRARIAGALDDSGLAVVEASLSGDPSPRNGDLSSADALSIHAVVVLAGDAPSQALSIMEALRGADQNVPIVVVASEDVYWDLWPRTAELGVLAFFSTPVNVPLLIRSVDGLLNDA